jgi:hypothetical protein
MKVRCINNDGWSLRLTIGKIYEVIEEEEYFYTIVCDLGRQTAWRKVRFIPVYETIEAIYNATITNTGETI